MAKKPVTVTSRSHAVKDRVVAQLRDNPALARRLEGNPHGGGNRDLPLREPERWHTYLANTWDNANAFWDMRELGWVPLEADDLSCKPEECGWRVSPDGHIVRGPQSQEMLFKMDREIYDLLQQKKTEANLHGIGSQSKVKDSMAEAAAAKFGGEAGDFMSKLDGQVIDQITSSLE